MKRNKFIILSLFALLTLGMSSCGCKSNGKKDDLTPLPPGTEENNNDNTGPDDHGGKPDDNENGSEDGNQEGGSQEGETEEDKFDGETINQTKLTKIKEFKVVDEKIVYEVSLLDEHLDESSLNIKLLKNGEAFKTSNALKGEFIDLEKGNTYQLNLEVNYVEGTNTATCFDNSKSILYENDLSIYEITSSPSYLSCPFKITHETPEGKSNLIKVTEADLCVNNFSIRHLSLAREQIIKELEPNTTYEIQVKFEADVGLINGYKQGFLRHTFKTLELPLDSYNVDFTLNNDSSIGYEFLNDKTKNPLPAKLKTLSLKDNLDNVLRVGDAQKGKFTSLEPYKQYKAEAIFEVFEYEYSKKFRKVYTLIANDNQTTFSTLTNVTSSYTAVTFETEDKYDNISFIYDKISIFKENSDVLVNSATNKKYVTFNNLDPGTTYNYKIEFRYSTDGIYYTSGEQGGSFMTEAFSNDAKLYKPYLKYLNPLAYQLNYGIGVPTNAGLDMKLTLVSLSKVNEDQSLGEPETLTSSTGTFFPNEDGIYELKVNYTYKISGKLMEDFVTFRTTISANDFAFDLNAEILSISDTDITFRFDEPTCKNFLYSEFYLEKNGMRLSKKIMANHYTFDQLEPDTDYIIRIIIVYREFATNEEIYNESYIPFRTFKEIGSLFCNYAYYIDNNLYYSFTEFKAPGSTLVSTNVKFISEGNETLTYHDLKSKQAVSNAVPSFKMVCEYEYRSEYGTLTKKIERTIKHEVPVPLEVEGYTDTEHVYHIIFKVPESDVLTYYITDIVYKNLVNYEINYDVSAGLNEWYTFNDGPGEYELEFNTTVYLPFMLHEPNAVFPGYHYFSTLGDIVS